MASRVTRLLTKSNYDHVAMILKESEGNFTVLESTATYGVSVIDWDYITTKSMEK